MKKIIVCSHCGAINKIEVTKLSASDAICGKCSKELDTDAKVQTISFDKLEKIIQHSELPVFVDVYADWCGPCKMYGPIFSEYASKNWQAGDFYKIDSEKNPMISVKYGIRGIPTTLIFKNNKMAHSQSGVLQNVHLDKLLTEFK